METRIAPRTIAACFQASRGAHATATCVSFLHELLVPILALASEPLESGRLDFVADRGAPRAPWSSASKRQPDAGDRREANEASRCWRARYGSQIFHRNPGGHLAFGACARSIGRLGEEQFPKHPGAPRSRSQQSLVAPAAGAKLAAGLAVVLVTSTTWQTAAKLSERVRAAPARSELGADWPAG